jgi:hypothetical protein
MDKFYITFPFVKNTLKQEIRYLLPSPTTKLGRKTSKNEKIGIEIELEKVITTKKSELWKTQDDGSLKIDGKEFTICIYSDKTIDALNELDSCLTRKESNSRTGVHIHINISDLNIEEILLFIYLYYIFEIPLIKFSGERFNNIFCVPLSDFWNMFPDSIFDWSKYSAINVLPYTHDKNYQLQTIEFRQMRGNFNKEYINLWVQLIVSLKKYVIGKTLKPFFDSLLDANQSSIYKIWLNQIFKDKATNLFYLGIDEDIETNILNLKQYLDTILNYYNTKNDKSYFPWYYDEIIANKYPDSFLLEQKQTENIV